MNIIFAIFFFASGAVIGSFLNVLIFRYNSGFSLGGRSICFSCSKKLCFFELIPIFSFIFLRGRCSKCKAKISWQYLIVEFSTALIFLALFFKFGLNFETIFFQAVSSLLIMIFVYDLKHKIIPDGPVYFLALISFLKIFFDFGFGAFVFPELEKILSGPILAAPFFLLWLFSRGKWMGLGDAKLMLGLGFLLNISAGLTSIAIAFWLGTIVSLTAMFAQNFVYKFGLNSSSKKLTIKSEIPLAPFLIIGFYIVFFFGANIFLI